MVSEKAASSHYLFSFYPIQSPHHNSGIKAWRKRVWEESSYFFSCNSEKLCLAWKKATIFFFLAAGSCLALFLPQFVFFIVVNMATDNFVQPAIPRFDGHYDHWSMLMEKFIRSKEHWQVANTGIQRPATGAVLTEAKKLS